MIKYKGRFRVHMFVFACAMLVCLIFFPMFYHHYGEGAYALRATILEDARIRELCPTPNWFFLMPHEINMQDSDRAGELKLTYHFRCELGWASARGHYTHKGAGWNRQSLQVTVSGKQYGF
jgi:hypothetical protein